MPFCGGYAHAIVSDEDKAAITRQLSDLGFNVLQRRRYVIYDDKQLPMLQSRAVTSQAHAQSKSQSSAVFASVSTDGMQCYLFLGRCPNVSNCVLIDARVGAGHFYPRMWLLGLRCEDASLFEGTVISVETVRATDSRFILALGDALVFCGQDVRMQHSGKGRMAPTARGRLVPTAPDRRHAMVRHVQAALCVRDLDPFAGVLCLPLFPAGMIEQVHRDLQHTFPFEVRCFVLKNVAPGQMDVVLRVGHRSCRDRDQVQDQVQDTRGNVNVPSNRPHPHPRITQQSTASTELTRSTELTQSTELTRSTELTQSTELTRTQSTELITQQSTEPTQSTLQTQAEFRPDDSRSRPSHSSLLVRATGMPDVYELFESKFEMDSTPVGSGKSLAGVPSMRASRALSDALKSRTHGYATMRFVFDEGFGKWVPSLASTEFAQA